MRFFQHKYHLVPLTNRGCLLRTAYSGGAITRGPSQRNGCRKQVRQTLANLHSQRRLNTTDEMRIVIKRWAHDTRICFPRHGLGEIARLQFLKSSNPTGSLLHVRRCAFNLIGDSTECKHMHLALLPEMENDRQAKLGACENDYVLTRIFKRETFTQQTRRRAPRPRSKSRGANVSPRRTWQPDTSSKSTYRWQRYSLVPC